ncbi:MAG: ArnT family glycosyltransferase, partial [Isosphaeraceae bacterium]
RVLDALRQSPEHPVDAIALAMPMGLGLLALGVLGLGTLGWLTPLGLAALLAVAIELGFLRAVRTLRDAGNRLIRPQADDNRPPILAGRAVAILLVLGLLGTAAVATAPVTDGDALCYHLQVPKVFLAAHAAGFDPDLHETIYPLATELLYAIALEFRGPIACRWIPWFLGLALAASVTAMARPGLKNRAWWAGAIVLLAPAISNGMSAPLNDVALAAFGASAILAWTRLLDRPSVGSAVVAGLLAGLAAGVKYPALVLIALMGGWLLVLALREWRRTASATLENPRIPWLRLAAIYAGVAILAGGWWYFRAFLYTGNPVYPFFRQMFGGAGLDEVLDPIKRPMPVTAWNLLTSLVPLTLQPDRFDSFSHQFGPVFLLFLPMALLERPGRRVLGLAALGYLFLMLCLTQRQSMRFVLIALAPMSVAVAHGLSAWCDRRSLPARLVA